MVLICLMCHAHALTFAAATYRLADNLFDEPHMLHELHTAMDDRVLSLREKLKAAEITCIRSRYITACLMFEHW
jgi:hypothetical protein